MSVPSLLAASLHQPSHVVRFFSHPQTRFRLLKAADPILDAATEIAKAALAPPGLMKGLVQTRLTFRVIQHFVSLTHLFFNVIPKLIFSLHLTVKIAFSFGKDEKIYMNPFKKPEQHRYNEIILGNAEKIVSLAYLTTRTVKGGLSLFSTTICQPLLYLQTNSAINLGKKWEAIASSGQYIALAKHTSSLISYGFEMAYQQLAFERAPSENHYPHHANRMVYLAGGIIENGLQLFHDTARILQPTLHPAFRLPLTFAMTGLGLYRCWLLTESFS